MVQADCVLDVGDAGCGAVVEISLALQGLAPGAVLEIRSTDSAMAADIGPWTRLCGHTYLGAVREGDQVCCFVRKG